MMIRVILSIILFCVVTVETDAQSVSTDSMKNDKITGSVLVITCKDE